MIPILKLPRNRLGGFFTFLLFLFPGIIPSCDLFNNSMVDYTLDNIEIARVTGFKVKTEYVMMDDETILIPPGTAKIGVILSNPRNFSVRQELFGVPEGKNISARQIGAEEIEVDIGGAAEGDDYALTLLVQSPDGLRDFAEYPLRIKCVSFETALQDFTVNGEVPPDFDPVKNAFQVNLPHGSATVTLGVKTVHPGAVVEIYAGTDDSGAVLAGAAHTAELERDLAVGANYFYLRVTAPSSTVQGYALTLYRAPDPAKVITEFYFAIGGKYYGLKTGDPSAEPGSGSISGTDITVTLPYGTNLTSLTPTVTHSGASISPSAGTAWGSSSSPKTYTVTAADGTSQAYTVKVNGAPGITIGIRVEGLAGLTFSGVPESVDLSTSITITIDGGVTVSDWYIEVSGPSVIQTSTTNSFTAPTASGFYNVNVFATVDGVDYSGSFGLIVK